MVLSWWSLVANVVLAATLFLNSFCSSEEAPRYTFTHDAKTAPNISYYDYIIVGGGTAGCPLAATLSQNFSVLLLERGGLPYGNSNITNLASFGASLQDTSPTSPAQRFISEDGVFNSRARVLGGGSCLNAGFYTRASVDYVMSVGWDGNLVNQSYQWVEKLVAFEPPMLQWQSAVRDGLLEVGVTPFNGFTYDHIAGTKVGGTIFDRDGHRHTAADLLEYANPNGLTVLLNATVNKILFNTRSKPNPTAHGVMFTDASGIRHRAYLNNNPKSEIILSAGALGTPQMLMLSGVGPAAHLRSHNITVVLDQPNVGQGMRDNPMNAIYVPSPQDVEISLIEVVGITEYGSYIEAASGANFGSPAGFQMSFGMFEPQTGKLFSVTPEKDADNFFDPMKPPRNRDFRGGFILEKVLGPVSTGHLELRNRNPHDNPSVTFNYFKEQDDLRRCMDGVGIISRVIGSRAFSRFTYPNYSFTQLVNMTLGFPVNMRAKHENASTSIEQFCKDSVMTIWHYHGGCLVGSVVDHDYRVLGVNALRVVDGSTFEYSPGTNPQATVMMLGRYMGVRILNERLNSNGMA
ncbi:choline dehydrogenase [Ranunculus cassubicifolius]